MQLRLTPDEIRLLYEILHARRSDLCERLFHDDREIFALGMPQVARSIDFDSDELDCVNDLLRDTNEQFKEQVSTEDNPEVKRTAQCKLIVLRSLIDKVSEACAML